jgi:ribosome maturation factor RimP
MKIKPVSEIQEFLNSIARPMGIEVIEVEFKQGKNPSMTVYIDKDGGVDLDTCELFHRAIDLPLDEFDPTFNAPYTLNVSSPGVDRPFKTERDFLSHIGERVEVKLYSSIRGKKFYDGILTLLFQTVQIDYPKFSDWLAAPDGMSDNEYMEQKFGKEAADWFEETFIKTMEK